jgi:hypothetical protein
VNNPNHAIKSEIDEFLKWTRMPPSAFGWAAARDPRLVRDLKEGRELRFRTLTKVRRYLAFANREFRAE